MDALDALEVFHAGGGVGAHADQSLLRFPAAVAPQERQQRTAVDQLHHDHDRLTLSRDPDQLHDVGADDVGEENFERIITIAI